MLPERFFETMRENNRATASLALSLLAAAKDHFGDYYRWMNKTYGGAHNEHGIEADKRLSQMLWMMQRVADLQDESLALQAAWFPPLHLDYQHDDFRRWEMRRDAGEFTTGLHRTREILFELEMFAEAFYYFGFRTREVIRHLPGLKKFDCEGIRNVRNHRIEHPEKKNGVIPNGFAYGYAHGPVLKGLRRGGQEEIQRDFGLFTNAQEFAENLSAAVHRLCP